MVSRNKQTAKKRRGPIPKGEYAGKAKTINTRATPELRDWLEKAAKKSGRSLSQEIETRLRSTFREEEKLADRFGSHRTARVFQVIALVLNSMRNPENPDAEWLDDPHAFELGMEAIYHTLYAIRPKGELDPFLAFGLKAEVSPENVSRETWRDIANSEATLPLDDKMPFKQWFGRLLKNQVPDIVERAGERANAPKYERLDDDPPTEEEQIVAEQIILSLRGKK
jgi:hypothetical protein